MNHLKVISLEVGLLPGEVYRKLGCLAGRISRDEQHTLIERLLDQALPVVRGAAAYGIYPMQKMAAGRLELAGCPPITGPVDNHLRPAHRVVVFATTLGPDLENMIRLRAADGEQVESFILQAIGNAAVNAAVDAFADHLHWNEMNSAECLTPPMIPGCCGFDFAQLETLVDILDPRPIGLELLPGQILKPVFSAAGLFGIAAENKMEEFGIPCAHCRLSACRLHPRETPRHFG